MKRIGMFVLWLLALPFALVGLLLMFVGKTLLDAANLIEMPFPRT